MEDGGRTTVFLQRGGDVVVARASQPIDASYRLETVEPREIVFTYLPLKARQGLYITAQK